MMQIYSRYLNKRQYQEKEEGHHNEVGCAGRESLEPAFCRWNPQDSWENVNIRGNHEKKIWKDKN